VNWGFPKIAGSPNGLISTILWKFLDDLEGYPGNYPYDSGNRQFMRIFLEQRMKQATADTMFFLNGDMIGIG